jgi:hypothetical protein
MKLSLKLKALLITTGMFAGAIIVVNLIRFIFQNVSIEVLINVAGTGIIVFFMYMLYQITLSRLEYQETLKKLNEKY